MESWNCYQWMIAYIYFLSYAHCSFILDQGWLLSNHLACQNCLCPSFALLWKLLQMPSCSTNNTKLDKNNFGMFYKIDCCAAIHGQIWMNNVPNESRIIMLSCTEVSFAISFFNFEKFGVKPGFPPPTFLKLTLFRKLHVERDHPSQQTW